MNWVDGDRPLRSRICKAAGTAQTCLFAATHPAHEYSQSTAAVCTPEMHPCTYSDTQVHMCTLMRVRATCAGLYRGFGVTLVRDTPSHGVYFGIYEVAREVSAERCAVHESLASRRMLSLKGQR